MGLSSITALFKGLASGISSVLIGAIADISGSTVIALYFALIP